MNYLIKALQKRIVANFSQKLQLFLVKRFLFNGARNYETFI